MPLKIISYTEIFGELLVAGTLIHKKNIPSYSRCGKKKKQKNQVIQLMIC
jgi:hypothetical protein